MTVSTAIERALLGDWSTAGDLAGTLGADGAALLILLARIARVHRAHPAALDLLARAAKRPEREAELALEWQAGLLTKLGRYHEALALADAAVGDQPQSVRRRTWAAHLYRARYDRKSAIALLGAAAAPGPRREALDCAILAGEPVDRYLDVATPAQMREAGRPDLVARLADDGVRDEQAVLALWQGDVERARSLATTDSSLAHRCRGAACLLAGDYEGALRALEGVTEERDEEAHVLRAEALFRLGRRDDAAASLARAVAHLDGASEYLALIAVRRAMSGARLTSELGEEGTVDAARSLGELARTAEDPLDPEVLLGLLRGNRSRTPSVVGADGQLHTVRVAPSSRTLARWAQRIIEHSPPKNALAAFDAVLAAYPGSPWPFNYRGEVHLWLGELDLADADFGRALGLYDRAFWSFIGRAAVRLLRGDPRGAVEQCDAAVSLTGRVGPTLFIYRGEAFRRLGEQTRALEDLSRACREHPSRVSAWINLALADPSRLRPVFTQLRSEAAALIADSASEVAAPPAIDASADEDTLRAVLEHALVMMRGNRSSSCLTYFAGSELRFVARDVLDDAEELAAVRAIGLRLSDRHASRTLSR